MSLIKSISNEGHIDIQTILIKEGFIKQNDYFYFEIPQGNNITIQITIYEKQICCKLLNLKNHTNIKRSTISYRKDNFFERYSMLLDTIIDYTKNS